MDEDRDGWMMMEDGGRWMRIYDGWIMEEDGRWVVDGRTDDDN